MKNIDKLIKALTLIQKDMPLAKLLIVGEGKEKVSLKNFFF